MKEDPGFGELWPFGLLALLAIACVIGLIVRLLMVLI